MGHFTLVLMRVRVSVCQCQHRNQEGIQTNIMSSFVNLCCLWFKNLMAEDDANRKHETSLLLILFEAI